MTMNVGSVLNVTVADAIRVMAGGYETRTTGGKLVARVGDVASSTYAANKTTVVGHPEQEAAVATYIYGTSAVTTSKAITIQSDMSVTLQSGDTTIAITPDGVTITARRSRGTRERS
jgi:hypothetical protein